MAGRDGVIDARLAGPRLHTRRKGVAARKRSHYQEGNISFSLLLNRGDVRVGKLERPDVVGRGTCTVMRPRVVPPRLISTPQPQSLLGPDVSAMQSPKTPVEEEESRRESRNVLVDVYKVVESHSLEVRVEASLGCDESPATTLHQLTSSRVNSTIITAPIHHILHTMPVLYFSLIRFTDVHVVHPCPLHQIVLRLKVGIELSNSRPQTSCIENVREMKREIGVAIQRAESKHEGGNATRNPLAMQGHGAPRITADATDFSLNMTFIQARKCPIHYMSL